MKTINVPIVQIGKLRPEGPSSLERSQPRPRDQQPLEVGTARLLPVPSTLSPQGRRGGHQRRKRLAAEECQWACGGRPSPRPLPAAESGRLPAAPCCSPRILCDPRPRVPPGTGRGYRAVSRRTWRPPLPISSGHLELWETCSESLHGGSRMGALPQARAQGLKEGAEASGDSGGKSIPR